MDKLIATVRDLALAAFAAFVAALAVALPADVTLPGLKAAAVSAGYVALRFLASEIAKRLTK